MLGNFDVKLGVDIKGLQRGLRDAGAMLKGFGNDVQRTGQTLTRSLTLPITGLGTAMLKTAMDFESAMNQVGAVTGATGENFKLLREQAKLLGSTTKFTATEAAQGMNFLAMAGFNTTEIMKAMPGVLDLASAGAMDLATASDIASNILTGFNLPAENINQVMDVMAKTFTSANTNLQQLGFAMSYVAPVAAGFGVSIEETSAMIGMLSDAGIQSSMAGTTLRGILVTLGEASKELGFSLKNSNGELRPMADLLDELAEKSGGTQRAIDIFGKRAGPGLVALLSQGTDKLREFEQELKNSGGTAKQIAERQMEGLKGALTELRSAIEGMFIAFADIGILSKAEKFIDGLSKRVRAFTQVSDDTKKSIMNLLGVLAGLGPTLIAIGLAIKVVAGAVALLGGPVTAIIAGIVAVVGILYYLLDNWNAVTERMSDIAWWKNLWIEAKAFFIRYNPISVVIEGVSWMIRAFATYFSDFFNWFVKGFYSLKAKVLTIVADIVMKASQGLGTIPFMDGWADTAESFGKTLGMQAEIADKIADSGIDFALGTLDALSDMEKINPFRGWADDVLATKVETEEYAHEFKNVSEYITQGKLALLEMLGLTELLNMQMDDSATDDDAGIVPTVNEEKAEQVFSFMEKLKMNLRLIKEDTQLMKQTYEALGSSIADAFTTALMTGKSLLDQLKELGKVILGKAFQKLLMFTLSGGLSIGGELTKGFFGAKGGLLGGLFGMLGLGKTSVGDALITSSGRIVEFHPNDNILAMQNLGGLQTQGGTQNMQLGGEFRIKGSDLVLALNEAQYTLDR